MTDQEEKLKRLRATQKLVESGKAGVNKQGKIVSLDDDPNATPIPKRK